MPILSRFQPTCSALPRHVATFVALGYALVLTGFSNTAGAETYIWKDANGKTIISDSPPPRSSKQARTVGGNGKASGYTLPAKESGGADANAAAPASEPPPPGATPSTPPQPKTMADRELEFRKRQLEAKDREEKAAKEAQDKAQRREECARASQYLEALRNGQRIARYNDKGEKEILGDEQREAEIARAKQAADNLCK